MEFIWPGSLDLYGDIYVWEDVELLRRIVVSIHAPIEAFELEGAFGGDFVFRYLYIGREINRMRLPYHGEITRDLRIDPWLAGSLEVFDLRDVKFSFGVHGYMEEGIALQVAQQLFFWNARQVDVIDAGDGDDEVAPVTLSVPLVARLPVTLKVPL